MTKMERAIKGLECCLPPHDPNCDICPYDSIDLRCRAKLRDDVMALLKAQEPKMVQVIGTVGVLDIRFADCPWCGVRIHDNESQNYCGSCGKPVKWE